MLKTKIKNKTRVIDRWYPDWGNGIIQNVKKTVFEVNFSIKGIIRYDYPHAQFLDIKK